MPRCTALGKGWTGLCFAAFKSSAAALTAPSVDDTSGVLMGLDGPLPATADAHVTVGLLTPVCEAYGCQTWLVLQLPHVCVVGTHILALWSCRKLQI